MIDRLLLFLMAHYPNRLLCFLLGHCSLRYGEVVLANGAIRPAYRCPCCGERSFRP